MQGIDSRRTKRTIGTIEFFGKEFVKNIFMRYFLVDKSIYNISLYHSKMETPKGHSTLWKNSRQVFQCSVKLVAGSAKYFCCHIGEAFVGRKFELQAIDESNTPLLLLIIDVFGRLCIPSAHMRNLDRHHPTISISNFNQVFSLYQNRKRLCPLQQSNH